MHPWWYRTESFLSGSHLQMAVKDYPKILECLFIFSLVWSLGASTEGEGRAKFSTFLRKLLEQQVGWTGSLSCIEDVSNIHPDWMDRRGAGGVAGTGLLNSYDLTYTFVLDLYLARPNQTPGFGV